MGAARPTACAPCAVDPGFASRSGGRRTRRSARLASRDRRSHSRHRGIRRRRIRPRRDHPRGAAAALFGLASPDVGSGEAKTRIAQGVDARAGELDRLALEIHAHPELAFEERYASDALCAYLEREQAMVRRHAGGLETAFVAEAGNGGDLVAILGNMTPSPVSATAAATTSSARRRSGRSWPRGTRSTEHAVASDSSAVRPRRAATERSAF